MQTRAKFHPAEICATANVLTKIATEEGLQRLWPTMQPKEKQKTVIGKNEMVINHSDLPPFKELPNKWRKGEDSNLRSECCHHYRSLPTLCAVMSDSET
jgi:hypothetical protein